MRTRPVPQRQTIDRRLRRTNIRQFRFQKLPRVAFSPRRARLRTPRQPLIDTFVIAVVVGRGEGVAGVGGELERFAAVQVRYLLILHYQ